LLDLLQQKFRFWFARIWNVRGGGLYAVGWAATFLYLEAASILGAFSDATGVVDFLTSQLLEFVFRFLGESFVNMGLAFAWPVFVLQWHPPLGPVLLAAAFLLFPRFAKPYVTAWLWPDGEPEEEESTEGK
jgi:hypothetical protein